MLQPLCLLTSTHLSGTLLFLILLVLMLILTTKRLIKSPSILNIGQIALNVRLGFSLMILTSPLAENISKLDSMIYNELIAEVIKRVGKVNFTSAPDLRFSEQLRIWLEDFEHDILLSKGGEETLSEEFIVNSEFDRKLDEELHS